MNRLMLFITLFLRQGFIIGLTLFGVWIGYSITLIIDRL